MPRAALSLALAFSVLAVGSGLNDLKYTKVSTGACRGNDGTADKVSGVYTTGQTHEWCEAQCDAIGDCKGYSFQIGQSDALAAQCVVHSPTVAGSCSNSAQKTKERCMALGSCSDGVTTCGLDGSTCVGFQAVCENRGYEWTSAGATWNEPEAPWTSDSHGTTHIHNGNGNADWACYDIDLDDHAATCTNGDEAGRHAGYQECALKWTDTTVDGCVDIEGCPDGPCNSDDTEAWCCNKHVDDCSEWHYCGCERDFEAADTYEEADCDTAAGCVYTPAPKPEKVVVPHDADVLCCDETYDEGLSGACRGTDENGAQVGANSKYSNSCDADGVKKADGETGMTQAECEAGCAAENAANPGACVAYHHGAWCSIFGPEVDTGVGIADADPCWFANPYDAKEVTGTNTNIAYVCWTVKDASATCEPAGEGCGKSPMPSFQPTNKKSDGAAAVGLGLATVLPLMALF